MLDSQLQWLRVTVAGAAARMRSFAAFTNELEQQRKTMAQYAIAFDLDTAAMRDAGLTRGQITTIYQTEIPDALAGCGFTAHPQGSLYHTEAEADPITAIMRLQGALRANAQNFCRYVRRVHVFRMEEWSDVTALVSTAPAPQPAGAPDPEEELAEAEFLEGRRDIVLER